MNINDFTIELDKIEFELFKTLWTFTFHQLTQKEKDKWSVLEIIEHILITERVIISVITNPSQEMNPLEECIGKDRIHHMLVALRKRKILTLESLKPKGEINDIDTFETQFSSNRKKLIKEILSDKITIDNRMYKHPYLGKMTVVDWLNFLICHTQRHLDQLKEKLKIGESNWVLIIHEVAEYKAWEKVFESASQIRKVAGEISYQVLGFDNNPNKVVHFSKWHSVEAAKAFFESPALEQIRMKAGVKSPEFIYLNELKSGQL